MDLQPRVQKLQEQFGKVDVNDNEEWSNEHSAGQVEWPVDEMEKIGKKQKSKVETTCQDAVALLKKLPPGWRGDISRLKVWAMGQQDPPLAATGPR